MAQVIDSEKGTDIRLFNPVEGGGEKFFAVTTEGNPYGAPIVIQEPSLGVPCQSCGVDIDGMIVGALIVVMGKVVERFSWSTVIYIKKGQFVISPDGQLTVNDQPRGWLRAVFLPDKNRMKGFVGVFGPEKPDTVKVLEMEDLLVASL